MKMIYRKVTKKSVTTCHLSSPNGLRFSSISESTGAAARAGRSRSAGPRCLYRELRPRSPVLGCRFVESPVCERLPRRVGSTQFPQQRQRAYQSAPGMQETQQRKAQVRKTDFPLERAALPTDKPRRHLAEKDMKDKVIKITKGNRKQNEVRKHRLYEHAGCPWTRGSQQ